MVAEGVGFEPTVRLPVRLISSQVPLTTQPPFQPLIRKYLQQSASPCFFIVSLLCIPQFLTLQPESDVKANERKREEYLSKDGKWLVSKGAASAATSATQLLWQN